MKIDSHHHFWRYNDIHYGWMGDSMDILRRDFLPADLAPLIEKCGIGGVVAVQARQIVEETEWLLELAAAHDWIRGVVGWVELTKAHVGGALERFHSNPRFKGIRHVLHDEPDDLYMLRDDFNAGIRLLRPLNLVYDLLIFERHLPQTIQFVDRHPGQVFVVDHIAKPKIQAQIVSPWRELITDLARRPNVYCKISGMVTEADWREWRPTHLRPYLDVILSAFSPHRLMFGSDWPVSLLACPYAEWNAVVNNFVRQLSFTERERILGGTAVEAYRLDDQPPTRRSER